MKKLQLLCIVLCLFTGFVLYGSLIISSVTTADTQVTRILTFPAELLTSRFQELKFFFPALFLYTGFIMLFGQGTNLKKILIPWILLIFLTARLFLQVHQNNTEAYVAAKILDTFGGRTGDLLVFGSFLIECFILFLLFQRAGNQIRAQEGSLRRKTKGVKAGKSIDTAETEEKKARRATGRRVSRKENRRKKRPEKEGLSARIVIPAGAQETVLPPREAADSGSGSYSQSELPDHDDDLKGIDSFHLTFPKLPDLPIISTLQQQNKHMDDAYPNRDSDADVSDIPSEISGNNGQPSSEPVSTIENESGYHEDSSDEIKRINLDETGTSQERQKIALLGAILHEIDFSDPLAKDSSITGIVVDAAKSTDSSAFLNSGSDESPLAEISDDVKAPDIDTYFPGVAGLAEPELEGDGPGEGFLKNFKKHGYILPPEDLLDTYPDISATIDEETKRSGEILMQTLREFRIDAELTGIQKGPVVTMYEIMPAPGIRVQTISNLADNIALQLAASRVRIVAPIPGKQAVGIEVPNKNRSIVGFKEMLLGVDRRNEYEIPVVLGKDITGESQIIDLVKTPHLLIAGATGSGKSVCVNSIICSILYRRSPREVRMLMIDPKIVELKLYNDIPHLLTPVITEPKKALKALEYCLYEMERRYTLLDGLNVRDIKSYNKRVEKKRLAREKLPYIVVIIDEFADLMTTAGKELETHLARLAAMARAVGIHLVLATQRPSTNVITGIIKANIPSRIAFMVASNTDSRIIIDQPGAEKLLGRGDMLFASSWDPFPARIQGAYLSEEEVERVVAHVKTLGEPDYIDEAYFLDEDDEDDPYTDYSGDAEDPLMNDALKIVTERGSASASYLQRRLKIGYNRAARLVEEMEDRGVVGPARGSKAREVIRMPDIN